MPREGRRSWRLLRCGVAGKAKRHNPLTGGGKSWRCFGSSRLFLFVTGLTEKHSERLAPSLR
jgi:hypothetical protein